MVITEEYLFRITENSGATIDITTKVSNTDGRSQGVAEVDAIIVSKLVIKAERVTLFILRHLPFEHRISEDAIIEKVPGPLRLKFEYLRGYRIDEFLWNYV